jgi:hypothetical protein
MKPIVYSIYFLFYAASICKSAPPVKKINAFKQASIPGIMPRVTENEIKPNEEIKPAYNYWFYLEVQKKKNIRITGLWINGIRFDIKMDSIQNLPVKKIIYTGATGNDTITLAPETRHQVILIYPSAIAAQSTTVSKYLEELITQNELVISYTCKGKIYYSKAKTIRLLPPDVRV